MRTPTRILTAVLPVVLLALLLAGLAAAAYAADGTLDDATAAQTSLYDQDNDGCANAMRAGRGGPIVCDDASTKARELGVDPDDSDPAVTAVNETRAFPANPLAELLPGEES